MSSYYFSPALKRKAALQQQQAQQLASEQLLLQEPSTITYHEFDVLVFSIEQDIKALAALGKSEEKREKLTTEILPKYEKHIKHYCKQDEVYANPVLVRMVIWYFDVGDIHNAIKFGLIAIEQKQRTPQGFSRDLPTFFIDSLRSWAEQQSTSKDKQQALYFMQSIVDEVRIWPLKDVPKMKYLKQLAQLYDQLPSEDNQIEALELYLEAQSLGKAQCKTRIEQLQRKLNSTPHGGDFRIADGDRDHPNTDTESHASILNSESRSK